MREGLTSAAREPPWPSELIDPETEEPVALEEGARGELVFTHLQREAALLIRFRSHDVAEILSSECECGRTGFRFTVSGRSDDMFRVRGVNVFPSAVEELLREHGIDRFAIVLERFPVEPPVRILVEGVNGREEELADAVRARLEFVRDLDGDTAAPRGEVEASLPRLRRRGSTRVNLTREGTAAWIRWSRPERLNAFDPEALHLLGDLLAEAASTDARTIVCFGEGGAFSSGDDLRETAAMDQAEWRRTLEAFNRLTREIVAAPHR